MLQVCQGVRATGTLRFGGGVLRARSPVSRFAVMDVSTVLAVGLVQFASLACLVGLWRGKSPLRKKLMWSVPTLLPVVGPLLYIGLPDVQPESLQGGKHMGNIGQ